MEVNLIFKNLDATIVAVLRERLHIHMSELEKSDSRRLMLDTMVAKLEDWENHGEKCVTPTEKTKDTNTVVEVDCALIEQYSQDMSAEPNKVGFADLLADLICDYVLGMEM